MPASALVVCHGGHGTVARALASGCGVVIVPAGGDMNESAARVEWAGVGVRLPGRLLGPRGLALAVGRALARPELREGARGLQAWSARHDGPARAADLVEELAARA
jgi:UDP:flavonoid glycosyltransferase YjiC (YdhE family)